MAVRAAARDALASLRLAGSVHNFRSAAIWRFPGIGVPVPLVIIHFNSMFPYKSSILGIPP